MQFHNICLAYNLHKPANLELATELEGVLHQFGSTVIKLPIEITSQFELTESIIEKIDLIIVLGGDGTLLGVARSFAQYNIKILGINTGNLGFLSTLSRSPSLKDDLYEILNGHYIVETRTMLSAEIVRKKALPVDNKVIALNEIAVIRSSRSSVLNLDLFANKEHIAHYLADGLIICTPTGSTAYSLGAGGAVLAPNIAGIQITAICAHSLTSRPLVISDSVVLRLQITPRNHKQALVTLQADGQEIFLLEPDDEILISRSIYHTDLLRSSDPQNSFYRVLNKKLRWDI